MGHGVVQYLAALQMFDADSTEVPHLVERGQVDLGFAGCPPVGDNLTFARCSPTLSAISDAARHHPERRLLRPDSKGFSGHGGDVLAFGAKTLPRQRSPPIGGIACRRECYCRTINRGERHALPPYLVFQILGVLRRTASHPRNQALRC